jgi:peptidylprolyl isomerase
MNINPRKKGEKMTQAKNGDTVKVHYTGKLEDGTQFDSSANSDPLEFTLGGGQVIPGFEEAVLGMNVGDSKTKTIPVEQAYGPHDEDMVLVVEKEMFPENIKPEVGQQLEMRNQEGRAIGVVVTEVTAESVTLDANHPLAGQNLVFDLELVEIA